MYQLVFDETIVFQAVEIYDNLESFQAGLGDRFYQVLDQTYDLIEQHPTHWQWAHKGKGFRRKFFRLSNRLEFVVVYRVIHFDIQILAIRNSRQDNEQWFD